MDITGYTINSFLIIIFYYPSGIPYHHGIIWNVPYNYRTGSNGTPLAHFYHGYDRSTRAHVCAFSDFNMAGQGYIGGNVNKITDFVVMVDQGTRIDDHVFANCG